MGLDVPKTNLVVVNSCPPSAWEFSQQVLFGNVVFFYQFLVISTPTNPTCHGSFRNLSPQFGRAGRSGGEAVCIYLRRKKEKTPAEMKPFLHPDSSICLKKGLVKIFSLTSPDGKLIVVE